MARKRIGDLLIERGLITEKELEFALETQKKTKEKLGEVLINNKIVTPENIAKTLAVQLEVDYVDLTRSTYRLSCLNLYRRIRRKRITWYRCRSSSTLCMLPWTIL